ncbi:hypothetical protein D3C78_748650 [compost metagenome]
MLQPGATGQGGLCVGLGLAGQGIRQPRQIRFDQCQRRPQLQHQAGVHGILAGGAQVHITLGLRDATGNHLAQRLDQRDRRVTGHRNGFGQRGKVIALGMAGGFDRCHRHLGDNPGGRFGTGQGCFEIKHALHPATVAEDLAHPLRGEIGIEQLIARSLLQIG